jgi:hypothetical protein
MVSPRNCFRIFFLTEVINRKNCNIEVIAVYDTSIVVGHVAIREGKIVNLVITIRNYK